MACYVYYDQNGVVKEMVNSTYTRKGDASDVNVIYFYFAGIPSNANVSAFVQKPDGTNVPIVSVPIQDNIQVPFDPDRVLQYFQYYTNYSMWMLKLPEETINQNGLIVISSTVNGNVYGAYNAVVENSAVQLDQTMTMGNYYYIIKQVQEIGEEARFFKPGVIKQITY